jgi:hypothetical protein
VCVQCDSAHRPECAPVLLQSWEMQGTAFIARLTAGAMAKWDTATAAVTLGSGILAGVTVAVYLPRRASR